MMLDAFIDRGRRGPARRPGEAGPDLLPDPHPRLDRRARGGPRRGAPADRRRLPEPARPKLQVKHRLLEADPTVIYAVDTVSSTKLQFDGLDRLRLLDRARTAQLARPAAARRARRATRRTQRRGLPPGPIATPTLARSTPRSTPTRRSGYLYFVAIPDGDGAHDFAKTLAEHEQKPQVRLRAE